MAKKKENEELPAVVDFGDDAGAGINDATHEELSIPLLVVLQALSPQVSGDAAVDGAKPGMLYNTVTGDLYDGEEGVKFVPAARQHVFVEWVPREAGGGFVAVHDPQSDVVRAAKAASEKFGVYKTPDGNDLVETFYLYGILLDEGGAPVEMVVVPFTSTKIKRYKAAVSRMRYQMVSAPSGKVNPPLWANVLRICTTHEKNTKGSFFNVRLNKVGLIGPDQPAYQAAKDLAESIKQGMAKVDHNSATTEAEETSAI